VDRFIDCSNLKYKSGSRRRETLSRLLFVSFAAAAVCLCFRLRLLCATQAAAEEKLDARGRVSRAKTKGAP
jgi:hypothetical protein